MSYEIIEKYQNEAGRWVVRVAITPDESAFFKFPEEPTQAQVDTEAEVYALNKRIAELRDRPLPADDGGAPAVITPRQFRLALIQLGLYDTIEAIVAQAPQQVRVEYEYAVEIRRDDALLNQMAATLGKSAADIDSIFQLGASFV